jgi:glutathione S-transferase
MMSPVRSKMRPMVTVHHLNNSRSQRILWLLEELGIEYELKRYERDAKTMLAPASLKAVHPLGKSPVITDGDSTVAESGAIIEYLIERYGEGRFIPKAGTPERLRYTYWLHFAEGSAMPLLVLKFVLGEVKKKAPLVVRPVAKLIANGVGSAYIDPNLGRQLDYIEAELGKSTWFAGDELTGADIQMSFPIEGAFARADGQGQGKPRMKAFLDRIRSRPAYKKALERGGPYDLG